MEPIKGVPWNCSNPPARILVVRLQAMGDMVITLPYVQHLRNLLPPGTRIDLLTRKEVAPIPLSLVLYDSVYEIAGGRNAKLQLLHFLSLVPRLLSRRYNLVLDLQNNTISRLARQFIRPQAWTAFDRYSPLPAGIRTANTITAIGLWESRAEVNFMLKDSSFVTPLLLSNGWIQPNQLIILNPAGAFENRNWPILNYLNFAQLWLQDFPAVQFLMLGDQRLLEKANFLKQHLGPHLINLVAQTSADQAFAIIQKVQFILSEDSGLMHMAWVSSIPTLAMFGPSRSDWSRPLGDHSDFMDASDLSCGACMKEQCNSEDTGKNLCMTRWTAAEVYQRSQKLLHRIRANTK